MSSLTTTVTSRLRRAPARIIASVLAIALAVGAIGVFGTSGVASGSLQQSAEQDRLGHLLVSITPWEATEVASLTDLDGVTGAAGSVVRTVELADGSRTLLIGLDTERSVDVVNPTEGRLPMAAGEVVVSPGVAAIGDTIQPAGAAPLTVVGVGTTTAWADTSNLYTTLDQAQTTTGVEGVNHLSLRVDDPTQENLDATVVALRDRLAADDATFRQFPWTLPGGIHPIEDDLTMVSTMIGMLGAVAGVVALILLTSTTNALVAEQTREVAIMRALGGRQRPLRRRLRRLALGIALAGAALGVPLGVLIANYIARLILERFAGVTPDVGVSIPVAIGSFAFAVIGARLVAARAARRAVAVPLVDALRDADGHPFGRRLLDRAASRLRLGQPTGRMAIRNLVRRRGRSFALGAQIAAAVGAAITVASLAGSVVALGEAELEPWNWTAEVRPVDASYPFTGADAGSLELGVESFGTLDGWDVDLHGLDAGTTVIDTGVSGGHWLTSTSREAVVAESFARRTGIALGDEISVELASGPADYTVVGLHPILGRELFVNRVDLAADLGAVGHGNRLWTTGETSTAALDPVMSNEIPVDVVTLEGLFAEDAAARDIVLAMFTAIGAIVVTVAAMSVASTMAVQLYERRHEVAALQSIGSTRSVLRRIVGTELLPLAALGWAAGTVAGFFGAMGVMEWFASANAIDLATVMAWWTIPVAAVVTVALTTLVAASVVRSVTRRPAAVVLRGASC